MPAILRVDKIPLATSSAAMRRAMTRSQSLPCKFAEQKNIALIASKFCAFAARHYGITKNFTRSKPTVTRIAGECCQTWPMHYECGVRVKDGRGAVRLEQTVRCRKSSLRRTDT